MKNTIPLRENKDFKRLYVRGKNSVAPQAVVYRMKNRLGINRLGITASKKIGGAVQRNRMRRVIREAYRLSEAALPIGWDIVIVARKRTLFCKTQEIAKVIRRAFGVREESSAETSL